MYAGVTGLGRTVCFLTQSRQVCDRCLPDLGAPDPGLYPSCVIRQSIVYDTLVTTVAYPPRAALVGTPTLRSAIVFGRRARAHMLRSVDTRPTQSGGFRARGELRRKGR